MPVIGYPQKLGKLARVIQSLSEVPSRASKRAAAALTSLLRESFDAQSNPYGGAWAAYTAGSLRRGRRPPLLRETNTLRGSLKAIPAAGSGIRIVFNNTSRGKGGSKGYPTYLNFGTVNMDARPFLPTNGMPSLWKQALDTITQDEFRKASRK